MSEGGLSGGAWWSSGDPRLATPEAPAGAHSGPCVIESPWLLPLAGAHGALRSPLSTVVHRQEQGCRIQDGVRGLAQAAARTRAGERAAWRRFLDS